MIKIESETRMEEGRIAFKMLTVKPPGKRPLGRPRRRWEDNIRIDLKEMASIPEVNFLWAPPKMLKVLPLSSILQECLLLLYLLYLITLTITF